MRLLVVGAEDPVIRALLDRLLPVHEAVILGSGAPPGTARAAGDIGDLDAAREAAAGCQIGIISLTAWPPAQWDRGADALRSAGVGRLVAIGPAWGSEVAGSAAPTGTATLRYAPLLGPGATGPAAALVRAALGWGTTTPSGAQASPPDSSRAGWQALGDRAVAVVDTRDAAAAAETALHRAGVGCVWLTAGALTLTRLAAAARRTAARQRLPLRAAAPPPALDDLPAALDPGPARATLAFWPRHAERSVRDTVRHLAATEIMPEWHK